MNYCNYETEVIQAKDKEILYLKCVISSKEEEIKQLMDLLKQKNEELKSIKYSSAKAIIHLGEKRV